MTVLMQWPEEAPRILVHPSAFGLAPRIYVERELWPAHIGTCQRIVVLRQVFQHDIQPEVVAAFPPSLRETANRFARDFVAANPDCELGELL